MSCYLGTGVTVKRVRNWDHTRILTRKLDYSHSQSTTQLDSSFLANIHFLRRIHLLVSLIKNSNVKDKFTVMVAVGKRERSPSPARNYWVVMELDETSKYTVVLASDAEMDDLSNSNRRHGIMNWNAPMKRYATARIVFRRTRLCGRVKFLKDI